MIYAVFFIHRQSLQAGRNENIPNEIHEFPAARIAEIEYFLASSYPWGVVDVYHGKTVSGDQLVVEYDNSHNRVTAYEISGDIPLSVQIDYESAQIVAEEFLMQIVPDLDLNQLLFEGISPGEDSTIKEYRFEWKTTTESGAIIPPKFVVYIDAEDGGVSDYFRIDYELRVDTKPAIDAEEAVRLLEYSDEFTKAGDIFSNPILAVLPSDGNEGDQRLVWIVSIQFQHPSLGGSTLHSFMIDAHSGELLKE